MGDVVQLKPAKSAQAPAPDNPFYYCQKCEGQSFRLFSSGEVLCGGCGARMRNLAVSEKARA